VRETGIAAGFSRDGNCCPGVDGMGQYTVCIEVTADFLAFSEAMGNDLITPLPEFKFPGLQVGDRWCVRRRAPRERSRTWVVQKSARPNCRN